MLRFRKLFPKSACSVIGMIHVGALPGTPKYNGSMKEIIKNTLREAMIYKDCQVDGIIVENMHDVPYVKSKDISSETTAMMTKVCVEIRKVIPESIACGIQILAGCNKEALAVAKAADFNFIRSEGYIFSHIADEGFIDGCSGNLLRYRKHIDAENILIFADIKKKHSSHAITSDINIAETVKAAEFFLADGVILTGSATGDPVDTFFPNFQMGAALVPVVKKRPAAVRPAERSPSTYSFVLSPVTSKSKIPHSPRSYNSFLQK